MQNYIDTGKMNEAKKFLPKFHSQLMKVAKTGVISKKTASRKISRVTKKINNSKKK
jgi:small subunit ribosomal protein S20